MTSNEGLRLVFMGAPGSGKGSQSVILKDMFKIDHLSTGDMLREAVTKGTSVGLKAKAIIDRGDLVSDDIVLSLVKERIGNGFILDGFPRTITQAEGLDKLLSSIGQKIDYVFYFKVDEEQLVSRICGRRVHLPSGRIYHIKTSPPKVEGKDDITGEPLTHRKDDNEETLRKRLDIYNTDTAPILQYYERENILIQLDAMKPIAEVTKDILKVLKI